MYDMSTFCQHNFMRHLIYQVVSIDHITVMMCVAEDERILPTFLIYQKNLPTMPMEVSFPAKWMYGTTANGNVHLIN